MTASRRSRSSLLLCAVLPLCATALAHAQGIEKPRVPLRTAIREINTLRAEYADYYNQKNAAALGAMYASDAVVIRGDGSVVVGQPAITQSLVEESPKWKKITVTSDTLRVFGNTAWDVGRTTTEPSGNEPSASRYLVVLRRGVQAWRIMSVAIVPETRATATK